LTKNVFTVFHKHASDILQGSKQWWTLASKISRVSGPSNPRRIDTYWGILLISMHDRWNVKMATRSF